MNCGAMRMTLANTKTTAKRGRPVVIEKPLKSTITATFTRDECLIIESFLAQYELSCSMNSKESHLRLKKTALLPLCKLNRASFVGIRYKIENIINPKSL